ncbi:uncharacterized protein [Ptychodera flava]|uniref:uncharacterized protein n=1 Tax=Ptychodera flava TaxID=63121 RepID=UPI003969BF38
MNVIRSLSHLNALKHVGKIKSSVWKRSFFAKISTESKATQRALILCPTAFDESTFSVLNELPQDFKEKYSLNFARWNSSQAIDLNQYTEQCIEIVNKHDIDLVVSGADVGSVVHAALADTFPHIRGPSIESAFLTVHKYYGAQLYEPDVQSAKSMILELDADLETLVDKANDFLQRVGGICCIKPVIGESSLGVQKVMGLEELRKNLVNLRNHTEYQFISEDFAKKWIDVKVYPYSLSRCALLEEYIEPKAITTANVCVQKGKIKHLGIHDWLFDEYAPREGARTFLGGFAPSSVTQAEEQTVTQLADSILAKLIQKGFNDQFLNIEFFALPTGGYKFLEVNGRLDLGMAVLCRQLYNDGDFIQGLLKLGSGENIASPTPNGLHGMWGFVDTFASGKAEDILNFNEMESIPDITALYSPGDHIQATSDMYGTNLATTYIIGHTREEIIKKHYDICRRVLKKPEYSPWGLSQTTHQ